MTEDPPALLYAVAAVNAAALIEPSRPFNEMLALSGAVSCSVGAATMGG